ncbi:MAG: hypothetical protein V1822_01500 [Candidatus Micrarchaeota archaeon]
MDDETTFFVLSAGAFSAAANKEPSFEYSLVQIPMEKVERALWMLDGIERVGEKIGELGEKKNENFGGEVGNELLGLRAKVSGMRREMNDYLGKNAISYLKVIERGQQTFFEGDGIPSSALKDMVGKGLLDEAGENLRGKRGRLI